MSVSRVMLFQRQTGAFLTTITTKVSVSWVRNAYGTCAFDLSVNDAKAIRRYLEFGTLVCISFDDLPAWGGVLDPDLDWNDDGTISLNAYSGEYALSFRRTPMDQVKKGASAGALFRQFINMANQPEHLLISDGSIWQGGTSAEDTMDGRDFYEHAKELAVNRGNDFEVEPVIDPILFRLSFKAHYWERRGVASSFVLKEGLNIEKRDKPLKVQRRIVNDLLGIGSGSDDERPTRVEIDTESVGRYGLRQGSEDYHGNIDPATLRANTAATLRKWRHPRNTFRISLLDVDDAFQRVRVGNRHRLQMHTIGFLSDDTIGVDTTVEVLAMRYKDDENIVDLTVEEVIV